MFVLLFLTFIAALPLPTKKGNDALINISATTGMMNSKVCHHCTAALQYGGFESLGPHQINTLTKHKIEKQLSAYGPVAERKTFERGQVTLPYAIGVYENMLFGDKFVDWRNKADKDDGDKSSCCLNFLNGLLPWLVEVLVQDNVFFICDYLLHPLSSWLKNSIPNSEKWSAKIRMLVAAKIQAFDRDRVSALNAPLLNS
jgi:hypothetical protein